MKIPIKFRGRRVEPRSSLEGKYVYGESLIRFTNGKVRIGFPNGKVHIAGVILVWQDVDPDSVAQLVGYDVDGKEVYEGDTLIDILGNEYTAKIRIELTCDDKQSCTGKAYYAGTVDNLKLKEKAA